MRKLRLYGRNGCQDGQDEKVDADRPTLCRFLCVYMIFEKACVCGSQQHLFDFALQMVAQTFDMPAALELYALASVPPSVLGEREQRILTLTFPYLPADDRFLQRVDLVSR